MDEIEEKIAARDVLQEAIYLPPRKEKLFKTAGQCVLAAASHLYAKA